jgi:Secretion system C-terminal sorting domain
MKKKLILFLFLTLTSFNLNLLAQCVDSDAPVWSPLPSGTTTTSANLVYPSSVATGNLTVTIPGGTTSFFNSQTPAPNTASFNKPALGTATIIFPNAVSKSSTLESFKLASLGRAEGQIVSAKDINDNDVFPIWASDAANVDITGINKDSIIGNSALLSGIASFSFNVPIKKLIIRTKSDTMRTTSVIVIFQKICVGSNPTPVELTFFKAKAVQNSVKLRWQTASEKNNKGFEIFRSVDANTWENIGGVKGQGNSTLITNYSFEDKYPLSILPVGRQVLTYYRLKQIDLDGKENFSNIESVALSDTKKGFKIYPNPIQNKTATLELEDNLLSGTIQILNTVGSVLKSQIINNQSITLDLFSLPVGLYFIKAQNNQSVFSEKILIAN